MSGAALPSTTRIISRQQIEEVLPSVDLLEAMREAFIAYSDGRAVVPPVGELLFDHPRGEAHIKYGYVRDDPYFVVKIATGFYENPALGLPPFSGVLLAFDRRTGVPAAILLDEGLLTNLRTAAAGALASGLLAPPRVQRIAILGGGVQARLQLESLAPLFPAREVSLWARGDEAAQDLASVARRLGFSVHVASAPAAAVQDADLVVTATASTQPLIRARDLKAGVHITAVGSDTPEKQELHQDVLERAAVIVADSVSQCRLRGELHHALSRDAPLRRVVELGDVLAGRAIGRERDEDVTIADLTGVAVQDIAMVNATLGAV